MSYLKNRASGVPGYKIGTFYEFLQIPCDHQIQLKNEKKCNEISK